MQSGAISIGSGASTAGKTGAIAISVGSGNSGTGGLIIVASGESTVHTGGAVGVSSGQGIASTSGAITISCKAFFHDLDGFCVPGRPNDLMRASRHERRAVEQRNGPVGDGNRALRSGTHISTIPMVDACRSVQ